MKKYLSVILVSLGLTIIVISGCQADELSGRQSSDYENSVISDAVPVSIDENGEKYYNPTKVAVYAIQYCGHDAMTEKEVETDEEKAAECIKWLIDNAEIDKNGSYVWKNTIYDEYSDITCDTDWISAYTQAVVAEAFISGYIVSNDETYLQYAEDALKILTENIDDGGLLIEENGGIWFATCPESISGYELIGHVRALAALKNLCSIVPDGELKDLYDKGESSLLQKMKFYDTDYCLRDNLLIKDEGIRFRFFNEYGEEYDTAVITGIVFKNPVTKNEMEIGEINENGEFALNPAELLENPFQEEWMELKVTYDNSKEQRLCLQKESLIDNEKWKTVKDGDLLCTGEGENRTWIIPVRINDLGYEISEKLMYEYKKCFAYLAEKDELFSSMAYRSNAYYNLNAVEMNYEIIEQKKKELPSQTPVAHVYSFDENGVLRQHITEPNVTEFDQFGEWVPPSVVGGPSYNLYVISFQAKYGWKFWSDYKIDVSSFSENQEFWQSYDFLTPDTVQLIDAEAAYKWLEENAQIKNDIATWSYDTYNCYNDLEQEAGWSSAYGQALVIETLLEKQDEYTELIKKGCYAFGVEVDNGGLASYDYKGDIWFEEVPNKSHIFNADILSINILKAVSACIDDNDINNLIDKGVSSLRENIWRYDTGYWSKYDMNPQKEMLFQIDWIDGETSPLIDTITLYDPVSECANVIDVGEESDFESYPYIAGMEWGQAQEADGVTIRSFDNGYLKDYEVNDGFIEQNSFFRVVIPELVQGDYFDLMPYKLVIRYKDVGEGIFEIKRQSICEGNYLKFEQIPNAQIECIGDGQWKEAEIIVRPQDLGWFMGPSYQEYHVAQLRELAEATDDWFFEQYAEKWEYYLEKQEE